MTQQDERSKVVETLPEVDGISEEAVANAKAMIGMRLRTEQFTRDASLGALLNFVNPGHPACMVLLPFVSDLRSGAFTGGGGPDR